MSKTTKKVETVDAFTATPREVVALIEACFESKKPVFMWGQPGIGKSQVVAAIAKRQNRPMVDIRLLLCDPTDIKGIPYYCPESNTMRWAPPGDLPAPGDVSMENAIIFLDEMNAAPQSVQAAAYQLVQDRKIGTYTLPEGVDLIAAGNRENDRGTTYHQPSPLANRFIHVEMRCSWDDWFEWAISDGKIHPEILGFLMQHKQHLNNFSTDNYTRAFATPRSWANLSMAYDKTESERTKDLLVAGAVGPGLAHELAAHRRFAANLPLAEDVLTGRITALSENEISAQYTMIIDLLYTLHEWIPHMEAGTVPEQLANPDEKLRSIKNAPKLKEKDLYKTFNKDQFSDCVANMLDFVEKNFKKELLITCLTLGIRNYGLMQHLNTKNKRIADAITRNEALIKAGLSN